MSEKKIVVIRKKTNTEIKQAEESNTPIETQPIEKKTENKEPKKIVIVKKAPSIIIEKNENKKEINIEIESKKIENKIEEPKSKN
jgi:hypothetical protein